MLKKELRKSYINKRSAITSVDKNRWDDLVLIQFQKIPLPSISTVFSYLAMESQNEMSTDAILGYLEFKNPGLQVAYPVCDFDNWTMDAVSTNENTLFVTNSFGTTEPEGNSIVVPTAIDLVLVPLLSFDEAGYRVGYGKGFYDKYLSKTRENAIKIGLSYFNAVDAIADKNEWDIPLDFCVTPQKVYEF